MKYRKPALGDIYCFGTAKGMAFMQYSHRDSQFGHLVRIFRRLRKAAPRSLDAIAAGKVWWSVFFPLPTSIRLGLVRYVGSAPLSPENARFPIFRAGLPHPKTGLVATWYLWDGNREWRVDSLSPIEARYPEREISNLASIRCTIERGGPAKSASISEDQRFISW